MPPLSQTNEARKTNFIQRWFGLGDGAKVQSLMTVPTEKPQPQLGSGFVTEYDDPRVMWVMDKLKVESDRLATLTDIRIMLDEASYVEGPCDQFCRWATEGKINFNFNGGSVAKATRIVGNLFDRISLQNMRADLLYNAIFLELFIKQQIQFSDDFMGMISGPINPQKIIGEFQRGMRVGSITELLCPPAETMFRNSNAQDGFDNPKKAFYQIPEPYNQTRSYSMPGAKEMFQEWFHHLFILHPRWGHRRQKNQRYSRPALKSARKHFNRAELSATDAVIQRHLTASRLLVIYLKKYVETGESPGMSPEEVDKYSKDFLKQHPRGFNKPGTVIFESGANEVESVGDLNITLSKPADIYLHLELLFMNYLFPTQLSGFSGGEGGRVTGDLLEQLKKILEVNISFVNVWEDTEILLPLINMELALNGVFDTQVMIHHTEPSFDSKSVTRKTHITEVEMGLRSSKDYYEKWVMPETGIPFETHWTQALKEKKDLAEVQPKSPFGERGMEKEGVDKGQSGKKGEPAKEPIQPER